MVIPPNGPMVAPDSRKKYIAIIVDIYKFTGYNLEKTAERCRVSYRRFLKWLTNSPDLGKAIADADKDLARTVFSKP